MKRRPAFATPFPATKERFREGGRGVRLFSTQAAGSSLESCGASCKELRRRGHHPTAYSLLHASYRRLRLGRGRGALLLAEPAGRAGRAGATIPEAAGAGRPAPGCDGRTTIVGGSSSPGPFMRGL